MLQRLTADKQDMRLLTILLLALPLALAAQQSQINSVAASSMPGGAFLERTLPPVESSPAASGRTFYRWSVALLALSSAADAASSWGGPEANPVLAKPGSAFGAGSIAIKLGLVGSCFALEHLTLRRHPELRRRISWMNIGVAAGQAAIVGHNISVR
jgi:hypothetical protein